MHSLRGRNWLVVGGLIGSVRSAVVPAPAITPAPQPIEVAIQSLQERQVDAASLAQVLLTALPLSLRLIAATNVPAVSSILWGEFLDDNKPQWFLDLPWDIQSYLIVEFGPETAWPTASPTSNGWESATATEQSSVSNTASTSAAQSSTASGSESLSSITSSTASSSRSSTRASSTSQSRTVSQSHSSTASAATDPAAPDSSSSGLSRRQKIGLGVGVPFALLGLAAILFACCFCFRRRRRRHVEGSEPPSSPGFIPRFSFQDRTLSSDHYEHRAPLNTAYNTAYSHHPHDVADTNWEEDEYEPVYMGPPQRADTFPPASSAAAAPMAMHDPQPIMAPALYHTHSSNRARGKRTSYTSLHSVAEVTEPDEEMTESPILGRRFSPPRTGPRRPSMPSIVDMPPVPAAATIKRKPVPSSPTGTSPAAEAASRSLLRPTLNTALPDHSGSSSSGLAVSSTSSYSGHHDPTESPISPISHNAPSANPFAGGYAYLEDYGPEYSNNGYLDLEDGLYGGHRSLDRYPDPSPPRKNSKTEWPLRNIVGSVKRNRSPMWDRVYER